jgi:hypothetical protein
MQAVQVTKAWKLSIEPWTRVPVSQFWHAIFFPAPCEKAFSCWRHRIPHFQARVACVLCVILIYMKVFSTSAILRQDDPGIWKLGIRSRDTTVVDRPRFSTKSFDITQRYLFMFNLFPPLHRLCWSFSVRVVKKPTAAPRAGKLSSWIKQK